MRQQGSKLPRLCLLSPWERVVAAAVAFLAFLLVLPAHAQTFPAFTGLVVDAANVIPPAEEAALTAKLDALQKTSGHQLVVATIPSLEDYPIEDYGYRLGRAWGVGLKGTDDGAILLVAPNERKVRVEVGYGLEPVLTDAFSAVVINERIVPAFKAGDLPGGIAAGADALIAQLSLPEPEAKAKLAAAAAAQDKARATGSGGGVPSSLLFWGIVAAFVLLSMLRGRRGGGRRGRRFGGSAWPIVLWSIADGMGRGSRGRGSGWGGSSGGGWGGGGFGGGGGSFGGGGASGSW